MSDVITLSSITTCDEFFTTSDAAVVSGTATHGGAASSARSLRIQQGDDEEGAAADALAVHDEGLYMVGKRSRDEATSLQHGRGRSRLSGHEEGRALHRQRLPSAFPNRQTFIAHQSFHQPMFCARHAGCRWGWP